MPAFVVCLPLWILPSSGEILIPGPKGSKPEVQQSDGQIVPASSASGTGLHADDSPPNVWDLNFLLQGWQVASR